MTVKDLIAELQKFNPDREIHIEQDAVTAVMPKGVSECRVERTGSELFTTDEEGNPVDASIPGSMLVLLIK